MNAVARLEDRFPDIAWREPISIVWPDSRQFACRICIAAFGLNRASRWQWPDPAAAEQHIRTHEGGARTGGIG